MLLTIRATEFRLSNGKATGHSEEYVATTMHEGARAALYTARLRDGRAALGSTGRVIYPHGVHGDVALVLTREEL